jgi:hypothetical protein
MFAEDLRAEQFGGCGGGGDAQPFVPQRQPDPGRVGCGPISGLPSADAARKPLQQRMIFRLSSEGKK